MGAVKLDTRMDRKNPRYTVKRLFADAFGPWPTLFNRTSWCGWRPVTDPIGRLDEAGNPGVTNRQGGAAGTVFSQEISMEETSKGLTIVVLLPLMIKESLCLEIADNVLMVSGDEFLSAEAESADEMDSRPGKPFNRVIALPSDINAGAIRARLRGNMLTIDISREE